MKRLMTLQLVAAALILSGCTSTPAALDECLDVVAAHVSVEPSELEVTERIKSPVGAYDWNGTAGDGTFACASPDGSKLTTALYFDSTGMPETLVVR